jgi:Uma2 family endonuclease
VPGAAPERPIATIADLLAIPESERFHEIVDGELVRRAMPSIRHGMAQMGIGDAITGPYGPRARGRGPGGWLFASETEIAFDPRQVYRPDVAGWKRERMPSLPSEVPIAVRPDWVCEIVSPSNAHHDLFTKMRGYHRAAVPHYWLLDPEAETLTVHRWTPEGFLVVQTASGHERLRPEPFEEVELSVHELIEGDP